MEKGLKLKHVFHEKTDCKAGRFLALQTAGLASTFVHIYDVTFGHCYGNSYSNSHLCDDIPVNNGGVA